MKELGRCYRFSNAYRAKIKFLLVSSVAGFCVSSTECSDHSLLKKHKTESVFSLFFDRHCKKANWTTALKKIEGKKQTLNTYKKTFAQS